MGRVPADLSQAEQGPDPALQLSGGAGVFPWPGNQVPQLPRHSLWFSLAVSD